MGYQPTKWDLRFLDLAKTVATWSKDPSTQCGAVIADWQHRIVSLGFNGLPRGIPDVSELLAVRDVKYKIILHAEINALTFARGRAAGCTLYTWPIRPCPGCASLAVQHEIARVVSPDTWHERFGDDFALTERLLTDAGVMLNLVTGA